MLSGRKYTDESSSQCADDKSIERERCVCLLSTKKKEKKILTRKKSANVCAPRDETKIIITTISLSILSLRYIFLDKYFPLIDKRLIKEYFTDF